MSAPDSIFRKVSLERLTSPEQLDLLVPTVTPRAWLAYLPLAAVVFGSLVWGIFASIPTVVAGRAILLQQGGLAEISAPAQGRVSELLVGIGDRVAKGQEVARIAQPEIAEKQRQAGQRLEELLREEARLSQLLSQGRQLTERDLASQRQNLVERLKAAEERGAQLNEKVSAQSALLERGLITRQTLLGTRGELTTTNLEAEALRGQIQQLSLRRLESEKQIEGELGQIRIRVAEARRDVEGLAQLAHQNASVESPYAGRVVELRVANGALVSAGAPLLSIEPEGGTGSLGVAIYLAAADGKRVQPGMVVQVSPSTVKREEYGYLVGEVSFVSDYPASLQSMRATLQNDALVNELAGRSTPIEIRARLLPSGDPGGYRWSSGKAPAIKVTAGTPATASIEVRQQPPIALVIPALRRFFGLI